MSYNYQRGDQCPARWTVAGQAPVVFNITALSDEIESLMLIATNTGTQGLAARVAGTEDMKGNIALDFDLDQPPYDGSHSLRNGVSGLMDFYVSPTVFNRFPIIIAKVNYQSAVSTLVKISVDVMMNCLQQGNIVRYTLGSS